MGGARRNTVEVEERSEGSQPSARERRRLAVRNAKQGPTVSSVYFTSQSNHMCPNFFNECISANCLRSNR